MDQWRAWRQKGRNEILAHIATPAIWVSIKILSGWENVIDVMIAEKHSVSMNNDMIEITQDRIRELFDYRDGKLYWKVYKSSRAKIGDLAGTAHPGRYRQIRIDGKIYLAHRLIFLYHHGHLPEYLDHIDGNKLNNDILNLRSATNQENHFNERKTKTYGGKSTSSQYKGVSRNKRSKKWQTHITIDGKLKNLGSFNLEIEAARTYDKAATELFGKFAKLNFEPKGL